MAWHDVELSIRKKTCSKCPKTIEKGEFYFRAENKGSGVNLCSTCLRQYADEVDTQNQKITNGNPTS